MEVVVRRVRRALTAARAETDASDPDPRLRGRTYAIPFEQVWRAALSLPGTRLARWRTLEADDQDGVILMGVAGAGIFRFPSRMTLRVGLDENAQTRVDAAAESERRADFGANARRLNVFLRTLDRVLTGAETARQGSRRGSDSPAAMPGGLARES